jgi:hypothetical protein
MPRKKRVVIGGVDTHKDVHVATVVDEVGKILDTKSFETTAKGYRALVSWLESFGTLAKVGVEQRYRCLWRRSGPAPRRRRGRGPRGQPAQPPGTQGFPAVLGGPGLLGAHRDEP